MKIFCVVLTILVAASAVEKDHPLSQKFINEINSKQSTWKAGKNFEPEDLTRIRGLLGVHENNSKHTLPRKTHFKIQDIPKEFDARTNWPDCPSIGEIRDQSTCEAAWAFGAVTTMTDRICIASNATKKVSVSAGDLLSCCENCGNGCDRGISSAAWKYWMENGIASGGGYGTNNGCISYQFAECDHFLNDTTNPCKENQPTPVCKKECDDPSLNYTKELTFGGSAYSVWFVGDMEAEILENGPIQASLLVYEDFLNYKSGVYKHVSGEYLGLHSVKILGWGIENDVAYWLVANSWNANWGDKGFFKILRGNNECTIEFTGYAGLPKL